MRPCSVRDCDRPHRALGYCHTHWSSFKRTGIAPTAPVRAYGQSCSVDDCVRPYLANGYCMLHRDRVRRHGDPLTVLPRRGGIPWSEHGKTPTYRTAHARVTRKRGPASGWPCSECGTTASDWCYDYTDPSPLVDPASGCDYSADPRRYRAMCRQCHTTHDRAIGRRGAKVGSALTR